MKVSSLIFVAVVLLGSSEAKIFSRCELAQVLLEQGFVKGLLIDWVCLIEKGSLSDTSYLSGPDENGFYNHGIFQIYGRFWCEAGQKGGECNAKCEDLRTNDIAEAAKCAMKVYRRHGFYAWPVWKRHCLHKPKPDLSSCKI